MKTAFISEWDTKHFGLKVAKMNISSSEEVLPALDFCVKEDAMLVITRVNADNLRLAHELEKHGFELMDTLAVYRLNLADAQIATVPGPATIRPCLKSDADDVAAIARAVFVDHVDHFHQDPRLDRDKCDALYAEWARNSCLDRNLADLVLVAEIEGKIVGFDIHKITKSNVAEGVLSGVGLEAQGKGLRKALMIAGVNWCKSQGLEWMDEGMHLNNYRIQRALASVGFKIYDSFYTFHKWL